MAEMCRSFKISDLIVARQQIFCRGLQVSQQILLIGGDHRLAVRAAEAFLDEFRVAGAVRIELVKRIPAGGGLGGGSSDAAAVLRLLASLSWPGDAPTGASHRLHLVAASLGSDVPFFLQRSPLALGRGRGEVLEGLVPLPRRDVVVALPPVHVSTPDAYGALARGREEPESRARAGAASPETDVRLPGMADWRPEWHIVERAAHNDFEAVVVPAHEAIAASLDAMRGAGASTVLLSGSGAASFGLFEGAEEAREVAAALTRQLGWSFLATATRTEVPQPVTR